MAGSEFWTLSLHFQFYSFYNVRRWEDWGTEIFNTSPNVNTLHLKCKSGFLKINNNYLPGLLWRMSEQMYPLLCPSHLSPPVLCGTSLVPWIHSFTHVLLNCHSKGDYPAWIHISIACNNCVFLKMMLIIWDRWLRV